MEIPSRSRAIVAEDTQVEVWKLRAQCESLALIRKDRNVARGQVTFISHAVQPLQAGRNCSSPLRRRGFPAVCVQQKVHDVAADMARSWHHNSVLHMLPRAERGPKGYGAEVYRANRRR